MSQRIGGGEGDPRPSSTSIVCDGHVLQCLISFDNTLTEFKTVSIAAIGAG
jgi:hypothetical protein